MLDNDLFLAFPEMSFGVKVCQTLCKPTGKAAFTRGEEHYCGVVSVGWRIEEEGVVCIRRCNCCKLWFGFLKGHQNHSVDL